MRTARFLAIAIVFSLPFHLPLWAQQSVAIDPQGRSFVQISVASLTRGVSITDITLTGTAHRFDGSTDETGTVVFKALATGEASAEFSYPSGTRSEVRANSSQGPVGIWSNADGTSGAIPLHNLLVDSGWFSPTLMLSRLSASGDVLVSSLGLETRSGVPVQHLSISKQFPNLPSRISADLQRLSQVQLYLDASTSLPVSVSFSTHPDADAGRDISVELQFSDYQAVNGAQVPFRIQKYVNGGLNLDFQLQKADLNSGLSVNSFSVPDMPSFPLPQRAGKVTLAN